jgi:hypothetical protein
MVRAAAAVLMLVAGPAVADPAPSAAPAPTADPAAQQPVVLTPLWLTNVPALPVPSLRLEAMRIAGERADSDWRYPQPGPLLGNDGGLWWMGYGHYRPRAARSAALHGGSIGATMVGQILMAADSPLAGVGALITGATLDAAAADVDRDAESRRR